MEKGKNQNDMLYQACLKGNAQWANHAINKGAYKFEWAFFGACEGGHSPLVELMLFSGDTQNMNVNAGFKIVCEKGYIDLVRILKEDYCADDFNGGLYVASLNGHTDVVLLLLSYGAYAYDGALFASCAGGHENIGSIMINMGANDWNRCYGVSCLSGHVNMVALILIHGQSKCDINQGIVKAASRGRLKVIRYILRHCGEVKFSHRFYCSDWQWASEIAKQNGYLKTSDYLVRYGNSISLKSFEYIYEEVL